MTWVYRRVASKQNLKNKTSSMTTTTALKEQIAALVRQLELTKEAEKREEVRQEAEHKEAEKAHEEEQRRLQAEAEAMAKHKRRDAEERCVEQEWWEKEEEEEEARCRRLRLESTLTPVAALEMELPRSKGKGPELAPESEGVQELQRCDSCERRDVECVQIKVSDSFLIFLKIY